MANVQVSNITFSSCMASILDLQNPLRDYNLRYEFYNDKYIAGVNNEYVTFTFDGAVFDPDGIYNSLNLPLNDWLVPKNNYTFKGYAEYPKNSGTWYHIGDVLFTANDISRPSTNQYLPSYYPSIRNQFVYDQNGYVGEASCCVASALSTALDIMEHNIQNTSNNYYSTSYIYGNRTLQPQNNYELSGMNTEKTIQQLQSSGSPVWQRIPQNLEYKQYPDNRFLTDYYIGSGEVGAATIYNNATNTVRYAAHPFKVGNYNNINFWDSQNVANTIQNNGYYIFNFSIPNNFYNLNSSGVVFSPDTYSGNNHTLLLIGWKTINGTKYWIGQQSWGTSWGDGGRCYIPMDWGWDVLAPNGDMQRLWCNIGQSISAYITQAPNVPDAPVFANPPRYDASLNLTWNPSDYSDTYTLRYKKNGGSYSYIPNISGNTYNITGLEYNTQYYVSVQGNNYLYNSDYSNENLAITAPKIPTLLELSQTSDSITVQIGVDSSWSKVSVWYRAGTDGWASIDINYPDIIGTITGLTAGQIYELKVSSWQGQIESGYSNSIFITLNNPRPQNWQWSYNISSGSNVYSISNTIIYIIPAMEWNNFTSRINEFRQYKNLPTHFFLQIAPGDDFTKDIMNEALYILRSMSQYFTGGNTLPNYVATGDNILVASLYTKMRDAMNSIT